ncbi:MAG TPA: elongation factor P [Candidatus Pacearchaeota archaeon]|nr:elongation factor P [Candidatus Pacearchaeota archaeon]HOK94282.1 elongation factor P [Candidatus Pacearchaeota archaeon]HPO75441.1 elongation factor P [Candidatus Pacearchaeota archaeon]
MISTSDFQKGIVIKIQSEPWMIVNYEYTHPGKGASFVRTKLRNLKTGKLLERTFKSGERFEEVELEFRKGTYLYSDRRNSVFQLKESKERISLPLELTQDKIKYLKQGSEVDLIYIDGKLSDLNIPIKVDLKVAESPPDFKGNTAGSAFKLVKLETGLNVEVPIFIKEGEIIRINTETGEYVERVSQK